MSHLRFGLVGHPLEHSFSRNFFSQKFEKEGLDCSFFNFDTVCLEEWYDFVMRNKDIKGFTVTYPFKHDIMQYLDNLDASASSVGAVNVIRRYEDDTLSGFNTDVIGFETLMTEAIKGKNINHALILGSGGASKAVQYVLKKYSISFAVVSRDRKNGDMSYNELMLNGFDNYCLIIQATPVGMFPDVGNTLPLPYHSIKNNDVFIDLIYNPEKTVFLSEAEKRGASIHNGLKMLYSQAESAWEIWTR